MEKISEFTIRRLSNYFRILRDLESRGIMTVSSARLAELGGITSAQVRKDLSYFGNFGTRGLGYKVSELREAIVKILGLHQRWTMALFGAGFLGHALFYHDGFREDGFYFEHIFDADDAKVDVEWLGVKVKPVRDAEAILTANPVDIGVLTTPKEAAQDLVDLMVRVGIKGILNFAPMRLDVPDHVWLRNVNLAVALESLSFYLSN